jgi:twinkle protein
VTDSNSKGDLLVGEYKSLVKRKISEETCRLFKYSYAEYKGETYQVANYYKTGKLVGQKLRSADKQFKCLGDMKSTELFGQHLWKDGGKMVIITEGEIDAMSVSQLQGNKYPVVSLPNGISSAKKAIQNNLDWLENFESVILMFDMDEVGQAGAEEVAPLFSPSKCKIARLPLKDANECLVAGKGAEVISAIWNAKTYKPESILSVSDAFQDAVKMPEQGIPFPWETLNKLTYGIKRKTSYYLGAGVGVGKTNWAKELQSWLVNVQGLPVGVFMLEESVGRTLKGIAGKFVGKPFHKPDGSFTQQELEDAIKSLEGKVYLYNHATSGTDWDSIKKSIRYMVVSLGIKDIFLDNLTVMVAHLPSSEANDEVNRIAKELAQLLQELDFTVYGFSHLNPPSTGASHERGGKVLVSQFTGSRGLMRFGNYMLGIERNLDPELPPEERNLSTMVLLKDREYGHVGQFPVRYYPESDKYLEPDPMEVLKVEGSKEKSEF